MNEQYRKERYVRQIAVKGFGEEMQEKLWASKVFVVGAGGLGSPVIQYLAGAGAGTLLIADDDKVEESNLHRQTIFSHAEIGKFKSVCAMKWVNEFNPQVTVKAYTRRVDKDFIEKFSESITLIVDATDNVATRYLLDELSKKLNVPLVYAGISRSEGQLSVFNYADNTGKKFHYSDLFVPSDCNGEECNCVTEGVISALPGIIGTMQAMEVIKVITGYGKVIAGYLLHYNGLTGESKKLRLLSKPENTLAAAVNQITEEIEVEELIRLAGNSDTLELIDVREEHEFPEVPVENVKRIPLSEFIKRESEISKEKPVYLICKSGIRSLNAGQILLSKRPDQKVYSVRGGLERLLKQLQYENN